MAVVVTITVSGTNVDFPVWIDLVDGEIAAGARPDGSDLQFTSLDGTAIPGEIQRWDPATGHLTAWVKLAALAQGADTVFYVRYGVAASSPQPVFTNGFAAVWHLDDPLTTSEVAESTATRPGTASGGLDPTHQVAAKLGGGIAFDGVADQIQFTNPLIGGGPHTISAWVDSRTSTTYNTIVMVGTGAMNQSRWFHAHYVTNGVAVGFFGNDWDTGSNVENAGWTLLHWVFNGSTGVSRLYHNGVLIGTHPNAAGIATQGAGGYIGFAPSLWGMCAFTGVLDEARIATVVRSASWVATEFANQSAPATFYSVGAEATLPP